MLMPGRLMVCSVCPNAESQAAFRRQKNRLAFDIGLNDSALRPHAHGNQSTIAVSKNPYQSPQAEADPAFDHTLGTLVARWLSSPSSVFAGVACSLPLINYAYIWVFWLLASISMGEWLRPSIHDPKDFFFGIPLYISNALMLMSFAVAPLVIAIGYYRGRVARYVLTYTICFSLSIVLFRLDLLDITMWICD